MRVYNVEFRGLSKMVDISKMQTDRYMAEWCA